MWNFDCLEDLHETLFHFLLAYRQELQNQGFDFRFELRAAQDETALAQGRWFRDRPEKNAVELSFTEHPSSVDYREGNPIWVFNQNRAHWFFVLKGQGSSWEKFDLIRDNFQPILGGKRPKDGVYSKIWHVQEPPRLSLPKALDLLQTFLRQSQNQYPDIRPISPTRFEANLQAVMAWRLKRQLQRVSLKSLRIGRYLALENLSLDKLPESAPWIFLTGENGFGKTLVLQALFMGALGKWPDFTPLSAVKTLDLELEYRLEQSEGSSLSLGNSHAQPRLNRAIPALVAYGPSRLRILSLDSDERSAAVSQNAYGLFHKEAILRSIEKELFLAYFASKPKYQVLEEMLLQIIPSLASIEVKTNEGDLSASEILYYEKNPESGEVYPQALRFGQLASGVSSILALVGDLYLRLSEMYQAQQKSEGLTNPPFVSPKDLYGLVIIDELDLHLHPKWQKELPGLLSRVFPKVQFIASTHSPMPVLGAPKGSVCLRVNRQAQGKIDLERLESIESSLGELLPQLCRG